MAVLWSVLRDCDLCELFNFVFVFGVNVLFTRWRELEREVREGDREEREEAGKRDLEAKRLFEVEVEFIKDLSEDFFPNRWE